MSIQAAGPAVARAVFNAMHRSQPDEVAVCSTTEDVVEAVKHGRENNLRVAVRGGGHSIAGLSAIEGGLLIDLAGMNTVEVDPEQKLAKVGGGALLERPRRGHPGTRPRDARRRCLRHRRRGLTLGGGYGWLRRKYGLSSDNIVEAEVVTADGPVRAGVGREPGPLLGDPRRRRQLRHRHVFHVQAL